MNNRRLRVVFAVFVAIAIFLALEEVARAQTPFYQATSQEIAGKPGTLIRSEVMPSGPAGATTYRVLYRSKGIRGEPIAVSGVVVVPNAPSNGPRPVVAWAHPTSGVVPHCAPSLAVFLFDQIHGAQQMIERGYVIAATDYPGLGTPGPHPYLVGTSEAAAVLDSVRVARHLPGVGAVRDFVVWGYSQGGQAALFVGLLAKSYAPDLNLLGVAAAAPATDLALLMKDDFATAGGKNLTAMTLWSWSRVYGAPLNTVVDPQAIPTVDRLANVCIESIFDILRRERMEKPLEADFLKVKDITSAEPWRSLLIANTPGPLPPQIPVFVAQGSADQVVRPPVTYAYMRRLCRRGSNVKLVTIPNVGHAFIARDTTQPTLDWIAGRFAGAPPPSDCGAVP